MLGAEKWELQSDGATFFRKFAEAIFDDSFALGTTLFSGKIPSALCKDSITKGVAYANPTLCNTQQCYSPRRGRIVYRPTKICDDGFATFLPRKGLLIEVFQPFRDKIRIRLKHRGFGQQSSRFVDVSLGG